MYAKATTKQGMYLNRNNRSFIIISRNHEGYDMFASVSMFNAIVYGNILTVLISCGNHYGPTYTGIIAKKRPRYCEYYVSPCNNDNGRISGDLC